VIAADITTDGGDFVQLEPMIAAAERHLHDAGTRAPIGAVLADAGYWSNGHIDARLISASARRGFSTSPQLAANRVS
jgi:hypothetical protein